MNEIQIKVGDTVERYRGGSNSGVKEGTIFIVSKVIDNGQNAVYDGKNNGHDISNIRLVTPKEPIINNTYPIY